MMPNKNKEEMKELDPQDLPDDSPMLDAEEREAITHPEEAYAGPVDSTYRPGDPPPGQSMFPPEHFRERIPKEDQE
jgi:hypothetical protein